MNESLHGSKVFCEIIPSRRDQLIGMILCEVVMRSRLKRDFLTTQLSIPANRDRFFFRLCDQQEVYRFFSFSRNWKFA